MISYPDRVKAVELINEATKAGARLTKACAELGICARTYRRWNADGGRVRADARPTALRQEPANKLCAEERKRILDICHEPEFASLAPSQIVPILADRGVYLGSESSFYRLLHEADEQHHRGRARKAVKHRPRSTHSATAPCRLWSWDVVRHEALLTV